jgi:hypothetical protein
MQPKIFTLLDSEYVELIHVSDYAKKHNTTRNKINVKRQRGTLKANELQVKIKGGFYFAKNRCPSIS